MKQTPRLLLTPHRPETRNLDVFGLSLQTGKSASSASRLASPSTTTRTPLLRALIYDCKFAHPGSRTPHSMRAWAGSVQRDQSSFCVGELLQRERRCVNMLVVINEPPPAPGLLENQRLHHRPLPQPRRRRRHHCVERPCAPNAHGSGLVAAYRRRFPPPCAWCQGVRTVPEARVSVCRLAPYFGTLFLLPCSVLSPLLYCQGSMDQLVCGSS